MAPAAKHCACASSLTVAATSDGKQPESTTALKALGEEVATRERAPTPYRCRMGSLLLAHLPSPAPQCSFRGRGRACIASDGHCDRPFQEIDAMSVLAMTTRA